MNTMRYNRYAARVEFDAEDRIFVGPIVGIRDQIAFHGTTVDGLDQAFRGSVQSYLAACKALGQNPGRPAGGKVLLRLSVETHQVAIAAAELAGKSLNQWAGEVLAHAVHR